MKFQQSVIQNKVFFCLILLFFGFMSTSVTHAETYIPVATWGSLGGADGFLYPNSVAVDFFGNVYVVDEGSRILKFDSDGTYIRSIEGGVGDGELVNPQGIDVDSFGNVYVADSGYSRIQKFDSTGTFITKWGSWGSAEGQFSYPCGVAVDSSGNVYVADTGNSRVQKFDSSGIYIMQWGSEGSNEGQFNNLRGIAVDSSGNVYVADVGNNRIQKFDSDGTYIMQWGSEGSNEGQFLSPWDVAVDSSGSVYVADQYNHRIQKFDSSGTFITKWGSSGSDDGQLSYPDGVAVDFSGNVYVSEATNHRIQKFALGDKITPIITWDNPADIVYGIPLRNTQLNAFASVPGTFTYSLADGTPIKVGTVLSAGTQTLHVDFTPTYTDYYNIASKDVTINVNKATPEITWSPADVVYGTLLSSAQLNAEAKNPTTWTSVSGSFIYTLADGTPIDVGTVLSVGTHTLHADFTPIDTANYNTASKDVTINIYKATPEIFWSNPADIVYGTPLSSTQLNAVSSVPGTFVYTLEDGTPIDIGAVLNAGTQTLHADFTPDDAVNYNTASMDVTINVLKATPTITWDKPADIEYGTELSSTQLNAVATVPGTFSYSPTSGAILPIGAQTLHVDFTPDDAVNYNTASMDTKINVLKTTPTITWNNPDDIVQGAPLSSTQLNAIASVPGTFVYYPRSGTVLSAGTQTLHVDFTPTDTAHYNTASEDVQINVLTPVQKIQQTTTTVQGLISSGVLNQKQGDTLISDLNAAIKALNDNQKKKAIRELNVFISHVEVYVQSAILTQAQGQDLINAANSVIYVL